MEAIGHILPIALAVAISSVPIMVTIYILLSSSRGRAALPFMIGWVIGILVVITICALVAQLVPTPRIGRRPQTAVGTVEILVGLGLIVLGFITIRRARHATESSSMPSFLDPKRTLGPWEAFGVAILLNVRPKALLLAIAGGLTIRGDASSTTVALVAILIYTVIGSSTVVVPIIATLVAPGKMEPRLTSARSWIARNGEVLTGIILIMIGVVIVGMGIARL